MTVLVSWRAGGVAQLVDRRENDPCGRIELGFEDLEHCDPIRPYLQHSPFCAGGRIECRLGEFDDVEFSDFVGYCHGYSMLEVWIGGDQSWRAVFIGVMQSESYQSAPTVHRKPDICAAGKAEWRPIMNDLDWNADCCLEHGVPYECPIAQADAKHGVPFWSVAIGTENPTLHLRPLVPGILDPWEGFTHFWWPVHRDDAMEQRRMCVRLKSIFRAENHTESAQE